MSKKTVEYKCFYKPEETVWKHFFFEASNDEEAIKIAKEKMESYNVTRFGVERIKIERIL